MPVPIARKATLAGAWADPSAACSLSHSAAARASCSTKVGTPELRLQHRSQRQVGDAQVDGHADRAVLRVDVTGDGDADRGDVLPQLAPGVVDESGDLADER